MGAGSPRVGWPVPVGSFWEAGRAIEEESNIKILNTQYRYVRIMRQLMQTPSVTTELKPGKPPYNYHII